VCAHTHKCTHAHKCTHTHYAYEYAMGATAVHTLFSSYAHTVYVGKRVFITNVKGTFLGMSESGEASKRR